MIALRFPKPERRPKARKPLRRARPIRRRRPRRLDGPRNDDAWRGAIALMPCAAREHIPGHRCRGRIEVAHEGKKPGVGMKCDDHDAIPLCSAAHREWTTHTGPFARWMREQRRAWADDRIAETQARILSHGSRRSSS